MENSGSTFNQPNIPNLPFNPFTLSSGVGSITGTGNLSPTVTGGNITFNLIINTGDGTATGSGGSLENTNSSPAQPHGTVNNDYMNE